ncbi:protein of unknown function [Saccharopolyspora shandongensis]|uniref:Uncharacterized protein n=1 Tax=Saccharopolyspora shandongensis TaxID=418495 RepID=A0A1H2XCH3_9PSEU|nr:DUF899 family protein [Saccharopolyspora shandongensis]SDW90525.1 protein of unknown function [Saccharopolyspora shandongensis]
MNLNSRSGSACWNPLKRGGCQTYSTYGRGMDVLGSTTSFLDLTALGRQEDWEEPEGRATGLGAPAGSPQVKYHDEY